MSKLFSQTSFSKPKRNVFDLSHEKKLSMNMGELIPILVQEVIPGDTFRVNTEALIRMAPMVAPVMHRVNAYTHYFFVPNRLTYGEWEKFITGGESGNDLPSFPKLSIDESLRAYAGPGTLIDYMGVVPPDPSTPILTPLEVSALPFRAYQMIYNEYYRDQNVTPKVGVTAASTVTPPENFTLISTQWRAWEKDYFSSALPWTQRGNEVGIPNKVNYLYPAKVIDNLGEYPSTTGALGYESGGALEDNANSVNFGLENVEDLTITVNDLRRSVRLQEWLEKNARVGSRYVEQILSHFGVKSSDARLQRPEYLGGGKSPIVISEVLSTFNNESVPGGTMYGHGVGVANGNYFKKSFEEHGYIIGILSVIPRTAYQNGVDRSFLKFDKFDYFWPEFAQLGEQPIMNMEIFHDYYLGEPKLNKDTWGYQSRYAEYKFKQSSVHGDFRDTLDFWHMGRKFETRPELNTSFIKSDPTHRIFADTAETDHKLYVQLYNSVKAIRPIPTFNTPTI
nr:MAG: major capsid protein [Microvirus sp.]